MSKLNKILGVFIFLLVVSSCSKDNDDDEKEEETFEINGTYKVDKVSKGGSDVAGSSGSFIVKKQSGDKVQLVSTKFTAGTWIKDASMNLLGDITKIDSKAYEIKVGDVVGVADNAYKIPFKLSVKLDDFSDDPVKVAALKLALGVDKVDLKDDAKMIDIVLTSKPATAQKITYGGKQYIGVIQKNQIELALNVDAVADFTKASFDVAGLIAMIQNPTGAGAVDVKAKIAGILNLADGNANKVAFNAAITGLIAKLKNKDSKYNKESRYNADYVFTLKKQ